MHLIPILFTSFAKSYKRIWLCPRYSKINVTGKLNVSFKVWNYAKQLREWLREIEKETQGENENIQIERETQRQR